jgi:hypothetical protein
MGIPVNFRYEGVATTCDNLTIRHAHKLALGKKLQMPAEMLVFPK